MEKPYVGPPEIMRPSDSEDAVTAKKCSRSST
jgi:hypothetical protein